MNISKQKVASLTEREVELINRVIDLISDLEDELEGEYDFIDVRDGLETIKYEEFVIEDENFKND